MTDETFECRDPNGVPFAETNNYVDRRWAMKTIAAKDARIAELEAALVETLAIAERNELGDYQLRARAALNGERG